MLTFNGLIVLLAQNRTETGDPSQTSWFPFLVIGLLIAAFVVATMVRRTRRAHNEPPAGSVPASEAPPRQP